MKKLLAAVLPLTLLLSCSSAQVQQAKPYLSSAEEVLAELLCAQVSAEKAGVTLQQARDAYCSTRDLWLPFLGKALEVKEGRASLSDAKASFTRPASDAGAPAPAAPPAAGGSPAVVPAAGSAGSPVK